jgi:hypothetical protein
MGTDPRGTETVRKNPTIREGTVWLTIKMISSSLVVWE